MDWLYLAGIGNPFLSQAWVWEEHVSTVLFLSMRAGQLIG